MAARPLVRIPVAVIMGRRMVGRDRWQVPSWRVVGVVAGEHVPGREARGVPVHAADDEKQFLWGGLAVELYRDAAEAYWVNLTGREPAVFVLCTATDDGSLEPESVTADLHEAGSGVEGNDRVFAAPIPPVVYQQMERLVVDHHQPQEKRKRKRSEWSAEDPS